MGTILVAEEGINGTVAGSQQAIDALYQLLTERLGFNPSWKLSYAEHQPFLRSKVRLKKEIVTMGQASAQPQCQVGTYVAPEDWNALLQDPEVVADTRNDYEYDVGTFKALNPTRRLEHSPVVKHLDPRNIKKWRCFALEAFDVRKLHHGC